VVTGDELREAMRRFANGIVVVTVNADGQRLGLTVGSLVSLSLGPPLVGISVGHQTALHAPLREAGRFVVNVLGADQAELAQHFARNVPPIALWTGIAVRDGGLPEPQLDGALAWLECAVQGTHEVGDHTFFVGTVLSTEMGRRGPGLAYRDGRYVGVD
jgi:flavin reductase (DIM6/NTAB) family NADH-FMN oxidoreductase RutF